PGHVARRGPERVHPLQRGHGLLATELVKLEELRLEVELVAHARAIFRRSSPAISRRGVPRSHGLETSAWTTSGRIGISMSMSIRGSFISGCRRMDSSSAWSGCSGEVTSAVAKTGSANAP